MNETPNLDEDIDIVSENKDDLWDEIGFHRPLAGFWYKLIFELGILIIPIFFTPLVLKILYPFPTSIGYRTTFTGIFVLVFSLFDIGTSNTISRFIADANIKEPDKMVQYIQYFIWYQALTGLVQITAISYWALFMVPNTQLAYGIWIMLICITKQWPGFPGVFKGVLNSLQHFDKKAVIDFVQGEAIQRLTEIGFVLLGKWWGQSNPEIGEIMGIAIGSVFGLYLDDVIASIIAGWYLSKSLEKYGITFKRLFMVEFKWDLVKRCFLFGLKTGLPGLLSAATKMVTLTLSIALIPQYTTFIVLQDMAIMLVAMTERLARQDFTPVFTEAYQNDKVKLCQYYNAHAFRFLTLNTGFAVAVMITVMTVLEDAFIGLGLDRYILTLPFIIPALLYRSTKQFNNYPNSILLAADKATFLMFFKIGEECAKMLCWYLTIAVFKIPELGIGGIVYTLTLGDYPVVVLRALIGYVYIHKKIFKLKFMVWQTFVVPTLSTATLFITFYILKVTALEALMDINFYLALVLGIVVLAALALGVYFPLTVLLGGWDDNSIRDFRKVAKMSGPSKIIVVPMSKLIFKTVSISPLHNKFKYDETEAYKEIRELMELRDENRKKLLHS
ncbi:MAG: hypothetical protein GF364_06005 [Candidatus Lokiarchaeota archaeon]|nr:hypothetical protein [Candidatus Lokiarchaeota archaeon]